jgi:general nucleoside transport system permease protein
MMGFRLEKRREPSTLMIYAAPVASVLLTMIFGAIIFSLIGFDGIGAVREIFLTPLSNPYRWQDLGVKAAPLIIIGVGLSIAYRANVWNIGAEGQYVMGGLAATWVALSTYGMEGWWILPAMALAGMVGGALYGAIPALLKTRLNVNEILTSLMLTYASVQLIYYLVRAPWRDPMGMGFPQTRRFSSAAQLPTFIEGTIVHWGVPIALLVALIAGLVMARSVFGYQMRVVGAAPHAARYGGFSENRTIWLAMLVSGGLAGFAGMLEVAGPFQRMAPGFPTNYGFTAIIVAFLGRLNPLGVIFAGIVMAITFVGGDVAQTSIGLSSAATGIFQAMVLFFLLASDLLVRYRIRRVAPAGEARA